MSQAREEIASLISSVGKYELRQENNEGMNAYAFVAKHIPLNRDVFLKIYDACSERTDIFQEPRFLVEATTGGNSTHLVNVLDAEKLSDDWVLIAMELVDGGSLLNAIENGPLPLMDAINVVKGILHGLSHLHGSCLVHRDIKPANILLTRVNNRLHPKLGDFGSVARLSSPDATVSASRHSALYVPPEGWAQPSTYGIRSDIYQVGLVLGELINGPLPYNDEPYLDRQAKSVIKKLGAKSLAGLADFDRCQVVNDALSRRASARRILALVNDRPYVNRTLRQIINTATNPDPSKRFSMAGDMVNALNGLHFPNWDESNGFFFAKNWNGWDWKIEEIIKRRGNKEIHIKRSRCGADNYRRWHIAASYQEAFNKVLTGG
jgi:serine/threonine protein kinase